MERNPGCTTNEATGGSLYSDQISLYSDNAIVTSFLSDSLNFFTLRNMYALYCLMIRMILYIELFRVLLPPPFATCHCRAKNLDVEIPPYLHPFCIAERWPSWIFSPALSVGSVSMKPCTRTSEIMPQNKWNEQHAQ